MAVLISVGYIAASTAILAFLAFRTVRAWRSAERIRRLGWWALGAILAFALLDWALIAALPRLGLSFGPVTPFLLALAGVRVLLYILFLLARLLSWLAFHIRRLIGRPKAPSPGGAALLLLWLLNLIVLGGLIDAAYFEPFNLHNNELDLATPGLSLEQSLRIVHLSDLHVERMTKRERELIELIPSLEADLIVLTGDYLNLAYVDDPIALEDTRDILARLEAPYGVYAVNGTVDSPERMQRLFAGLDIVVLDDEVVQVPLEGDDLYIVGVSNVSWKRDREVLPSLMEQVPQHAYTLLLYHTPDLIDVAAAEGVDLYLAGHTHGGQICLPWYGAVLTFSIHGKDYEQGRYTLGPTTLYVSRGLGMEGFWITPRVRFLCPPEVVVLNLKTEGNP